ncbi:MAG: proline racemase family protein [Planctomycetes bacterium]|nr:proline racemase family protein [Planctomycetota bacterium]
MTTQTIRVIDSHTEGEPTRVVIDGAPALGQGTAAQRRDAFRRHFDGFRSAVCNEPRGFDAMVGALLLPPNDPRAIAQVIFFNNVGYLGMCVHGTIGVGETLRHLGRIRSGRHRLETPVGDVTIELAADGSIAVENVESWRTQKDAVVETRHGKIAGDVAWGGNWFFLVQAEQHRQELSASRIGELTDCAWAIREALPRCGITGTDGAEIDHIELFGPPRTVGADSRNFVLCPGREYDRSPCGTGTSAKLACLAADGKLRDGQSWRQESILGTCFVGSVRSTARGVIPTVAGRAWITAESTLLLHESDPFREGIRR